jgi:hypothetical protein
MNAPPHVLKIIKNHMELFFSEGGEGGSFLCNCLFLFLLESSQYEASWTFPPSLLFEISIFRKKQCI